MADPDKSIYGHASGTALETVKAHAAENDLKCFFSWFCPYVNVLGGSSNGQVQRAWIALEEKDADYQYIEIQPYHKPKQLLDVNPKGLVPVRSLTPALMKAILRNDYCLAESLVLMEYIEEEYPGNPLLPKSPLLRARCRLAIDFINRSICPSFYKYLQEQDESKWEDLKDKLANNMLSFGKQLLENDRKFSDGPGDYYLGGQFTLVDIALIPWVIRMPLVLEKYKGFTLPRGGSSSEGGKLWSRIRKWITATESRKSVIATRSDEEQYFKVYERYARNTANSMVARATRAGEALP